MSIAMGINDQERGALVIYETVHDIQEKLSGRMANNEIIIFWVLCESA